MEARIAALMARPDVAAASRWIEAHDAATLDLQGQIAAIPAPTFAEGPRAAFIAERLAAIGLHVVTDEAGNVIASCRAGDAAGVVICSHLDTVFPDDRISVASDGDRVLAPGIGDNARGLAALLTLAEAMQRANMTTGTPITFVASVGEEGLGDLRGVKHLFAHTAIPPCRPTAFVALDGPGLDRIVHRALGSRRLRATYRGPGGHSWSAFGVPNPVHAIGRATAQLAEIPLPGSPRSALSVVRIGGGQSLNTIPAEAWLEFDLRSESQAALASLFESATAALQRALDITNRARANGTAALTLETTSLGERPSGITDDKHPLVRAAVAATRALGGTPQLAAASTDANVAISRGIPGIAIGAGGRGGDAHLASEWFENSEGPRGIVRCLLVALAAAEASD